MKTTATIANMLVRLTGVILIVLGLLFWIGIGTSLVPIHMLIGIVLVLALWVLAGIGAAAGASAGTVALAFVWGLIVVVLGATQTRLMPGPTHWVIQVIHLLVGLAAIGQAEMLGARIKRNRSKV